MSTGKQSAISFLIFIIIYISIGYLFSLGTQERIQKEQQIEQQLKDTNYRSKVIGFQMASWGPRPKKIYKPFAVLELNNGERIVLPTYDKPLLVGETWSLERRNDQICIGEVID